MDAGFELFGPAHLGVLVAMVVVAAGLVLLGILRLPLSSLSPGKGPEAFYRRGGYAASFLMGVIFALSCCPTSAALYFGSLIPLAVDQGLAQA